VFVKQYGMKARAYHGMGRQSWQVSGWSREDWQREAGELEVVVMTPEVCLHAACHGGLRVRGRGQGGDMSPWAVTKEHFVVQTNLNMDLLSMKDLPCYLFFCKALFLQGLLCLLRVGKTHHVPFGSFLLRCKHKPL
jgi:hypothetical protein